MRVLVFITTLCLIVLSLSASDNLFYKDGASITLQKDSKLAFRADQNLFYLTSVQDVQNGQSGLQYIRIDLPSSEISTRSDEQILSFFYVIAIEKNICAEVASMVINYFPGKYFCTEEEVAYIDENSNLATGTIYGFQVVQTNPTGPGGLNMWNPRRVLIHNPKTDQFSDISIINIKL